MNETNLQIAIKDYIKKLKSKNDLINDLNTKLEELKNKKDNLVNTKQSLKEQNNKIKKKKTDKIILSTLNSNKMRCSSCCYIQQNKSLSTSITQSNKDISVNQKTEYNNGSHFSAEKPKKNVKIAIFKILKKKNDELEEVYKKCIIEKKNAAQKVFEIEKKCGIIIKNAFKKSDFLFKK